jgi:hypothetical protein
MTTIVIGQCFLNYYLKKIVHLFQLVFFDDPPTLNAGELYCDAVWETTARQRRVEISGGE